MGAAKGLFTWFEPIYPQAFLNDQHAQKSRRNLIATTAFFISKNIIELVAAHLHLLVLVEQFVLVAELRELQALLVLQCLI